MTEDREGFLIELKNYEYGVQRIIPAAVTSPEDIDEAFGDEMDCLLFARDYLEWELEAHPDSSVYAPYLPAIRHLDNMLRAKAHVVLQIAPNFSRWRSKLKEPVPRSHWWWYLDELVTESYQSREEIVALPADRLALTLDSEVVARTGLRPGQQVTIQVSDDKHIVVSLA